VIRGARARFDQGVINDPTRELIEATVIRATLAEFRPLLLVIPWSAVQHVVEHVNPTDRARATSDEYIIKDLPRELFDILELHR